MRVWDAPARGVPAGYRDILVCGTLAEIRAMVDRYTATGELAGMTVPTPTTGCGRPGYGYGIPV